MHHNTGMPEEVKRRFYGDSESTREANHWKEDFFSA
jgi:hypothetical protein